MAPPTTQNPVLKTESKSAKKKKAKSVSAETETSTTVPAQESGNAPESTSGDGVYESPYIKELEKNIRNVTKKITNASKVDGIVAENKDKSLEQLVAEKKINQDQKAQLLKKPALEASLAQLKAQVEQYKKFDQEYKAAAQAEKEQFQKTTGEKAVKELEDAVAAAKVQAAVAAKKEQEEGFLALSQFLRLAAVRRGEDEDPELPQNVALEALLVNVYTGDASAVGAISKIIQGSTEQVCNQAGGVLDVTYAEIKAAYSTQPPPAALDTAPEIVEETPAAETNSFPVQSDPTIVNAGLTELDAPSVVAMTNGIHEPHELQGVPQNSGFGDGAANAAAETNWNASNDLSQSQEWVEVPRDAAETDTGVTATPAAPSNIQSWADDQPDSPTSAPAASKDDGFHEVQRNRGRGGQGQYRGNNQGRGGRGGSDGFRGGRGNYRVGRGRGGGGGAQRRGGGAES